MTRLRDFTLIYYLHPNTYPISMYCLNSSNSTPSGFKMSCRPPPAKYQKLDEDWRTDLLELFESGDLSDCNITVGSKVCDYKLFFIYASFKISDIIILQEFKCHSLILSSASSFFKKKFEGFFRGPKFGRDEPIILEDIDDPEMFESAMR
jgi:BTB/POZ domain